MGVNRMCELFVNRLLPPNRVLSRCYHAKHLKTSKMFPAMVLEGHLAKHTKIRRRRDEEIEEMEDHMDERIEGIVLANQSISQKLMLGLNLIHGGASGTYAMLPILTRSLEKLHRLIDQAMQNIGAQKVTLPCMASGALWKKSGRWDDMGPELLKFKDRRNSDLCLAPTHEEAISDLVSSFVNIPEVKMPVKFYQIGRKFRDEPRSKHGLLRSREFEMKDLYTFDICEKAAEETYNEVCYAYAELFTKLGLPVMKVDAATGAMGGSKSHEYHLESHIGEDSILTCDICGTCVNKELMYLNPDFDMNVCTTEDCTGTWQQTKGIEIAHAFLLGTKYTEIFRVQGHDVTNVPRILQMGCFGIGVSRLLAASAEVLSENKLRWPLLLAPYQISVIAQKNHWNQCEAEALHEELLTLPNLHNEVILYDSYKLSVENRQNISDYYGIPYSITIGRMIHKDPPKYELRDHKGIRRDLTKEQIMKRMSELETVIV